MNTKAADKAADEERAAERESFQARKNMPHRGSRTLNSRDYAGEILDYLEKIDRWA